MNRFLGKKKTEEEKRKSYIDKLKPSDNILKLEQKSGDFISSFCFPIINDNKPNIVKALVENNIETRPLIAGSIGKNPFWQRYANKGMILDTPNCDLIDKSGFYVPNHQDLSDEDIARVVNIISSDNSNLKRILSDIFPNKKIVVQDKNDGTQTIFLY